MRCLEHLSNDQTDSGAYALQGYIIATDCLPVSAAFFHFNYRLFLSGAASYYCPAAIEWDTIVTSKDHLLLFALV